MKTIKLIEIRSEDSIQAELEGCKRNKQIFEKIARKMKAAGYEWTVVQCREEITTVPVRINAPKIQFG